MAGFAASIEWAVLHYALARLGAVAVPLNLAYERDEIAHVLHLAAPEALVGVGVGVGRGEWKMRM